MQMSPVANNINTTPVRAAEPGPANAELAAASSKANAAAVSRTDALEKAAEAKSRSLEEALDSINKNMQALGQDLEFSVDDESKRTVVKVIDPRTQEVIRQMPSVEALEISKALDRVQGLLIRQKA
ncbi:MAG TPA: flagellar protein FlaG [Telluria sp.]|nr:flagellar protein FlaG [Telluria sp.]